jgi:hypothetical protein
MPGAPSQVGMPEFYPTSLSQEVESQVNRTAVPLAWKGLFGRTPERCSILWLAGNLSERGRCGRQADPGV